MNAFDRLMHARTPGPASTTAPRKVTYSDEQQAVVDALFPETAPTTTSVRTHVTVDAVAGSGKTTTIGAVLDRFRERYPSERALVIMYNKVLQLETEARIGSTGALIYTLHAAAGRCAGGRHVFRDDAALAEYLAKTDDPSNGTLPPCSLLVFDEMQDATPLYIRTLRWMIQRLGVRQLLFLGDVRQCINTYASADPRFLMHAEQVFGDIVPGPWVRKTLTTSYRCPPPVCEFMNRCLLGGATERFRSGRSEVGVAPKVVYVHLEARDGLADLVRRITSLHNGQGVPLESMAVLMPAVRSTNAFAPCARVANALTDAGFKVVTSAESHEERTLRGKVLISSIHQFKGRERDVIFLPQFDASADVTRERYDGTPSGSGDAEVDALTYVASTRARSRLVVYHTRGIPAFPWLNTDALPDVVEWVGDPLKEGKESSAPGSVRAPKDETATVTVTGLVRHIPISFALDVLRWVTVEAVEPVSTAIPIETVAVFETHCEDVSAVYGTAIPLMKEKQLTGTCCIGKSLEHNLSYVRKGPAASFLHQAVMHSKDLIQRFTTASGEAQLEDALALANLSRAVSEQLDFMVRQIPHTQWADGPAFEACLARLSFLTSVDSFEVPVSVFAPYLSPATGTQWHVEIRGAMDAVHHVLDKNGGPPIPYEFKVTHDLTTDHRLQVACYLALVTLECDRLGLPCRNAFRLMNCRTGQVEEIRLVQPVDVSAVEILETLVRNRFGPHGREPWDEVKRAAGVPEM